ncbi:MAG: hypothetical protein QGG50_06180 [Methanopyri archaeon]|jgi:hypothetical protein|nr:hypothetical protein [Methanopyri archaeon]
MTGRGHGWLALTLMVVMLTHLVLAALPRPVHELEVHTMSISGCPGGDASVNLTVISLTDQLLVVNVDLSSHGTTLEPGVATFSVGAGASLTRVVSARIADNATLGNYIINATVSLDDKPSVYSRRQLPMAVEPCTMVGEDGEEPGAVSWAMLFAVLVFVILAGMAVVVVRVSGNEQAQAVAVDGYATYPERSDYQLQWYGGR